MMTDEKQERQRYLVAFTVEADDRGDAERWAMWAAGYQPVARPVQITAISCLDDPEQELSDRGI